MAYRILLLEDDEDLLGMLSDVLEEEGFEVDTCSKSDSAINLAREKEYDLMVADIRMEGLDGLSALSHVQSYRPSVDALVISGYADAEQAQRASRLGLGAVLKKPFELDQFLHKVNGLLRERSKRQAVKKAFESLLATSYWSTQQLSRFLDQGDSPRYDFAKLVKISGLLCTEMNLLGSQLEKIRSAAIAAAWEQCSDKCSIKAPESTPVEFQTWFKSLPEWWNGSGPKKLAGRAIPLESRIIVAALASSLRSPIDDLEEKWPGRFDPNLLQILDHHSELSDDGQLQGDQESSESLLDLAGTLLRSGDFKNASEALQEVVNRGAESREGVSALLMLARLHQRSGQFEEARNMAFRTPELAQSFGPALAAHAFRESGKLLMDLAESKSAASSLERAYHLYSDLGLEAQSNECYLLSCLAKDTLLSDPEAHKYIEVLLSPEYRTHAAELASPIIAKLLSGQLTSAETKRTLGRLCLAYPYATKQALENSDQDQQMNAVELLGQLGPDRLPKVKDYLLKSAFTEVRKTAEALASQTQGAPDSLPLQVNTLGGFSVEVGGQKIPDKAWKTSKVRFLFARLIAAYPSPVQEDNLIEEFWPDDLEKGRKSLYTATSSMRGALRKSGLISTEYIQKSPTGLVLAPDIKLDYDVPFLKQTLEKAQAAEKSGKISEAVVSYRKAILLGENPYLPNCYYDWALIIRESLEQELLEACVLVTQLSFIQERFHEVIEFARRALKFDPANEVATGLLLEALITIGRPAEALREYKIFCKALKEELGIEQASTFENVRQRAVEGLKSLR